MANEIRSTISHITLPSGTTYDIKDSLARDMLASLAVVVAWDGISTPVAANIPAGVKVKYNNTTITGTLAASNNSVNARAFYLVKSSTSPTDDNLDIYDEYAVIKPNVDNSSTWFWEKIGDTKINLSNILTSVSLNQDTDTAIGTDATFDVTQPSIKLETDSTSATGRVSVVTGVNSVTQPSITLGEETAAASGRLAYIKSLSSTHLSANVEGGSVTATGDDVSVLTSLGTPATTAALTGVKVSKQPTITMQLADTAATGKVSVVTGVSASTKRLITTTIKGVDGSSTPSVVQGRDKQTTATGGVTSSNDNSKILANISVSGETLTIGAVTLATQDTYSAKAPETITIPTAAANVTRVATGGLDDSDNYGGTVATGASGTTKYIGGKADKTEVAADGTVDAITGFPNLDTDSVVGASSTFYLENPTVTLVSGESGDVSVTSGGTTRYLSASAENGSVTLNNTYIKASAEGADVAWKNKDSVTVLTDQTSITTTAGE